MNPKRTPRPAIAALIERSNPLVLELALATKQYRLTKRERETLELLIRGLNSEEIAARMNISRNTVKAFLRLVMVEMGVSTRSGVIGKVIAAEHL
jgi:DNA-binding CsgD family transcriptional regulator